jgi:predicted aconitase with swiveling domain
MVAPAALVVRRPQPVLAVLLAAVLAQLAHLAPTEPLATAAQVVTAVMVIPQR